MVDTGEAVSAAFTTDFCEGKQIYFLKSRKGLIKYTGREEAGTELYSAMNMLHFLPSGVWVLVVSTLQAFVVCDKVTE